VSLLFKLDYIAHVLLFVNNFFVFHNNFLLTRFILLLLYLLYSHGTKVFIKFIRIGPEGVISEDLSSSTAFSDRSDVIIYVIISDVSEARKSRLCREYVNIDLVDVIQVNLYFSHFGLS